MAGDAAVAPSVLPRGLSFRTTVRWAWTGACAVLDQGLFALSNFAVNVALARWLAPDEYGAFTLAYAVFLIVATLHTALIADPLIIFGAAKYRDRLRDYFAVLERGHWRATGAGAVLLALAGVVLLALGHGAVGSAFLALAVAGPLILLQWLMRRGCYVHVGPQLAALGGLVYMAVLVAGSMLLIRLDWLSAPAALLLMGAGSAVSAAWIRWRLAVRRIDRDTELERAVASDHWTYGRWAVGTGLLGALMLNIYYIAMPLVHGLGSVATLRALTNFVMPAMQAYFALSVVTVPALVRARGTERFERVIRRLAWLYGAGAFAYWLFVGLLHAPLVHRLYGGQYADDSRLLWVLGLVPFTSAGVSIFEGGLRSLERSDDIFRAYVLAAVLSLVVGVPAMAAWGVGGAALGLLVSAGAAVSMMAMTLRRRMERAPVPSASVGTAAVE